MKNATMPATNGASRNQAAVSHPMRCAHVYASVQAPSATRLHFKTTYAHLVMQGHACAVLSSFASHATRLV